MKVLRPKLEVDRKQRKILKKEFYDLYCKLL